MSASGASRLTGADGAEGGGVEARPHLVKSGQESDFRVPIG